MRTTMDRRMFLGLALTLPLIGCGGGGAGSRAELATLAGRVELPPGLSPTGARVVGLLGEGGVAADGAFELTVAAGATQLCQVQDSAGNLLLLGFLSEGRNTLSARSTAEALTYLALGMFAHASAIRTTSLQLLATTDLAGVESAIAAAVAASGASWLNAPQRGVGAAVKERVNALQGASRTRGMIVTPGERVSGLQIEGDGIGACNVTNAFRRRTLLFHTAYQARLDEGNEFDLPTAWKKTEISPTDGITSPLGALTDLFVEGKAYYQPASVTLTTPRVPDFAAYTRYKIHAVGPGIQKGTWDDLPPFAREEGIILIVRSAVLDFVLPFLISVVIPGLGDEIEELIQITESDDVFKDMINTIAKIPDVLDKIAAGDFVGACGTIKDVILGTDTLQIVILTILMGLIQRKYGRVVVDPLKKEPIDFEEAIPRLWGKIDGALDITEMAFTAFDTGVQALDIASSRLGESWEVAVTRAKVRLEPEEILVEKNALFGGIQANLIGIDEVEGKVFGYSWKCGKGKLSAGEKYGSFIETTALLDSAGYDAIGVSGGSTDTIEVNVVLGGREPVGSAKATVYITDLTLSPDAARIKRGERVTLNAQLVGMRPLKSGEKIVYRWQTTQNAGVLLDVTTEAPTATYQAFETQEGVDMVTVEAYLGTLKVGVATAQITVGASTITVPGRFFVRTIPRPDDRASVEAILAIPIVEGAKSYSVYAHGFNDPAFYGASYRASWTMPHLASGWGDHGAGEYLFGLAGGTGPASGAADSVASYTRRFAGIVVEVTVTL